jgi:hypothetical protein
LTAQSLSGKTDGVKRIFLKDMSGLIQRERQQIGDMKAFSRKVTERSYRTRLVAPKRELVDQFPPLRRDVMQHTFGVDVLACARCGGRMRVVATIDDPVVIRRILTHLGLPTAVPSPRPPPADLFGWS